ncbi:MAG: hypothetical protein FJ033_10300 [Chloroflexi bacterium]|nr:hypothetical protein [Chloroflexota bacterium]
MDQTFGEADEVIGVLYEHPVWFAPLFVQLDRLGVPYTPIEAHRHHFDPSGSDLPYRLIVNRVSPSAYLRDHGNAILYARHLIEVCEARGLPVINGSSAYALELSKALQLTLMATLGIPHPRSRAASSVEAVVAAATDLTFPLIVKPNIGGSGALMRRYSGRAELIADADLGSVFGIDGTAIVQEYHPPRDGSIVRVEVLDDRFLYAIRIYNDPSDGFNLCPADICQVDGAQPPSPSDFAFCPVPEPAKARRRIEVAEPPRWVVDSVREIFRQGGIDVGGVEYLESARDGRIYLYDVNALSNFVTDAPTLVGFDPYERLARYIGLRAGVASCAVATP